MSKSRSLVCRLWRIALLGATCAIAALGLPAAAAALTAPLPPNADPAGFQLAAAACPAAGSCVATGTYYVSSGPQQLLLEKQTAGAWDPASDFDTSLAPDATGFSGADQVACSAPGSCAAIGAYEYYPAGVVRHSAILVSETGGNWGPATELLAPDDVVTSSDPFIELNAVACAPNGSCAAVGDYEADATLHGGMGEWQEPLVVAGSGGVWGRATNPGLPADAATSPDAELTAISCPATGDCTAVGFYTDTSGHEQGLLLTQVNGTWVAPAGTDLTGLSDAPAANPGVQLNSVSCNSPGDCVAVGSYEDHNSDQQALIMTESNGSWSARSIDMTHLSTSDGVYPNPNAQLWSVSCPSAGSCAAIGYYQITTGGNYRGMLETESDGSWAPAATVDPPAGAAGTNIDVFFDHLQSIACSAAGTCVADGFYQGDGASAAGIVLRLSDGTVTSASVPLVAGSSAPDDSNGAVSCSASGYCAIAAEDSTVSGATGFLLNAPGAVGSPSAAPGTDQATVSWTAPDDGGFAVTGYTVTATDMTAAARGGQSATTTGGGVTLAGLKPGDSYTFTVTATNLLGTGIPASSGVVTIPEPAAAPPASAPAVKQINVTLAGLLVPRGKLATRARILENKGFTFRYQAPESGRLVIDWYYVAHKLAGKGKHRHRVKVRTLVAKANVNITSAKTLNVKVRLTNAGKRLLRTHKRLRLTSQVSFTPTGGKPIKGGRTFTLH